MSRPRTVRIGVIADTHGLFDPAIIRHFRGVDRIIHAGDIGDPAVIVQLRRIAPVTAVSGNVDGYDKSGLPSQRIVKLAGRRIAIRHVLYAGGKLTEDGRAYLERERPDVCIFGHTHQPKIELFGKALLFNPGSAGPKRFKLSRGLGILTFHVGRFVPRLISLQDCAELVTGARLKANFDGSQRGRQLYKRNGNLRPSSRNKEASDEVTLERRDRHSVCDSLTDRNRVRPWKFR